MLLFGYSHQVASRHVKHSLARFWCFALKLATFFIGTGKWPVFLLRTKAQLISADSSCSTSTQTSSYSQDTLSSPSVHWLKISERAEVSKPLDVTSYSSQSGLLSCVMTTSTFLRLWETGWFRHLEAYKTTMLFIQFGKGGRHSTPR